MREVLHESCSLSSVYMSLSQACDIIVSNPYDDAISLHTLVKRLCILFFRFVIPSEAKSKRGRSPLT